MSETAEILEGTITELENRETALVEEIERVQQEAKVELRGVRKALTALRKQVGAVSPNGNGSAPVEVSSETKDAVMRELEAKAQDGAGGARPTSIAKAANLSDKAVRAALDELSESGDVESYGKGLWRIAS